MKNEIRFALYAIKKNIKSSAELRGSFIMNIVGMMLNNLSFVLIWLFMIQTVGSIGGWNSAYVIGLQGFSALSFGICFSFLGGITQMCKNISNGNFDRFILSPKDVLLRSSVSYFTVSAIGDVLYGIICLLICLIMIKASIFQAMMTVLFILLTSMVFITVSIFCQSLAFYFEDGESVANSALELFFTPSLMHGGAFQGEMRFVFTFLIPSLLFGTLPVEAVINMDMEKLLLIAVLSIFWLVFSIIFFYKSLRRYESANFMTFGS